MRAHMCMWPHDVPIMWSTFRIPFSEALVILAVGVGFTLLFCLQSACAARVCKLLVFCMYIMGQVCAVSSNNFPRCFT